MLLIPRLPCGSARTGRERVASLTVASRLWYRAVLCDGPIGAHYIPVIREHFAEALEASGWPKGACLFISGHRTAGTLAGEDDTAVPEAVFFSPAAIAEVPHLIAACRAEPSPPPTRAYATLLVGKPSDWDLLPWGSTDAPSRHDPKA